MSTLFEKHQTLLEKALETSTRRDYWSPFIESPFSSHFEKEASNNALSQFQSLLGKQFHIPETPCDEFIGDEISPYTQQPLDIKYPSAEIDKLFAAAKKGITQWAATSVETRVGICMEILMRLYGDIFLNAHATMHTTGQAFMMSFAGSGANSLDRGLEGIAFAYKAMKDIPSNSTYQKTFGRGNSVTLEKQYRLHPVGISIVMSCGSYPAWNAYPALMANLATGNPVLLKTHPDTILPMALTVQRCREVLSEQGFDPNLVILVPEERNNPLGKKLLSHPDAAIIDFTGSQQFGRWIEENGRHLQVYTETAGCNAVVLESTHDIDGLVYALAHSLCLFSSQMCTAPQNIFIPKEGIRHISESSSTIINKSIFEQKLVEQIRRLTEHSKTASGLCGSLQTPRILDDIEKLQSSDLDIALRSRQFEHVDHPTARTATPLLIKLNTEQRQLCQQEHFGPIAFLIECESADQALEHAATDAQDFGSIAAYAYSCDSHFIEKAEQRYALAGASIGINLYQHLPINFTAGFSDYHVTGMNPAGNACLTDLSFVTRRFRITQSKREMICTE